MQVDPITPTLKAPGTKRLKLKCDILLSTSAFTFNLRRYVTALQTFGVALYAPIVERLGRAVQVDPIKPTLKAPGTKRLNL